MRITCPICGERDHREFYFKSVALARPEEDAAAENWADYLHLRENVAGEQDEFWHHEAGCGAWLIVRRNNVTHEVLDVRLAKESA